MSKDLLRIQSLTLGVKSKSQNIHTVRDLNLTIKRGETLGIVGESGCGKTKLGLSIMNLLFPPTYIEKGQIFLNDINILNLGEQEIREVRGKHISMIFQDPMTSLNPIYTIEDQIKECFYYHQGITEKEAKNRALDLLTQVWIKNPANCLKQYPHQLSGGMLQRVMIAMAISKSPQLIIADEPTTALDVTTQYHILELLKKLQKKMQMAMILITHDLGVVSQYCDNIAVMYAGRIVEKGVTSDILQTSKHPYTRGLLHSIPRLGCKDKKLSSIPGSVPSFLDLPKGCVFHPRCHAKSNRCLQGVPKLSLENHSVACYHPLLFKKKEDIDVKSL